MYGKSGTNRIWENSTNFTSWTLYPSDSFRSVPENASLYVFLRDAYCKVLLHGEALADPKLAETQRERTISSKYDFQSVSSDTRHSITVKTKIPSLSKV